MNHFFDPNKGIEQHGSKLPHWQQGEAIQFVTFRLGDSLPDGKLKEWERDRRIWLSFQPEPWDAATEQNYHLRFSQRMEAWLDQGHGSCLLRKPDQRAILKQVLMRDHGARANHISWVIMPNHVHLLFNPLVPMADLIKSWKGVSARRIGCGPIWQRHYRDTLIRNPRHFAAVVRYIRKNPSELASGTYTLWESQRALEIE